jgi:hypothetical protein
MYTELILVLVLLVIVTSPVAEHMTRIRRTVGTANEANETQVAPGVVNSVPIMDYTHTYWDGSRVTSCDECPNGIVCPACPQFRTAAHTGEKFMVKHGGVSPRETILDSDYEVGLESFHADNATYPSGYDIMYPTALPTHDLDSGYITSRERMGACSSRTYGRGLAAGYVARNDTFDMIDDTDNGPVMLRCNGGPCSPAIRVLADAANLMIDAPPAKDECEYYGYNGYLYKERC